MRLVAPAEANVPINSHLLQLQSEFRFPVGRARERRCGADQYDRVWCLLPPPPADSASPPATTMVVRRTSTDSSFTATSPAPPRGQCFASLSCLRTQSPTGLLSQVNHCLLTTVTMTLLQHMFCSVFPPQGRNSLLYINVFGSIYTSEHICIYFLSSVVILQWQLLRHPHCNTWCELSSDLLHALYTNKITVYTIDTVCVPLVNNKNLIHNITHY